MKMPNAEGDGVTVIIERAKEESRVDMRVEERAGDGDGDGDGGGRVV